MPEYGIQPPPPTWAACDAMGDCLTGNDVAAWLTTTPAHLVVGGIVAALVVLLLMRMAMSRQGEEG